MADGAIPLLDRVEAVEVGGAAGVPDRLQIPDSWRSVRFLATWWLMVGPNSNKNVFEVVPAKKKKNPVGARNMNEFPTTEVLEELDGQLVMLPLARIYLISFDPFLFQGVMAGMCFQFENLTVSVVFYDSFSASVQVSRKKKL